MCILNRYSSPIQDTGTLATINCTDSPITCPRLLVPLDRAFLKLVEKTEYKNKKEKENGHENRKISREELTEYEYPRNQKDDFYIKENKEHCSDVKLDRKSRMPRTLGQHATLVGCILDRRVCPSLPEHMRRDQNHPADARRDQDLNKNRIIVRNFHNAD